MFMMMCEAGVIDVAILSHRHFFRLKSWNREGEIYITNDQTASIERAAQRPATAKMVDACLREGRADVTRSDLAGNETPFFTLQRDRCRGARKSETSVGDEAFDRIVGETVRAATKRAGGDEADPRANIRLPRRKGSDFNRASFRLGRLPCSPLGERAFR
jgi:hypothetical protein